MNEELTELLSSPIPEIASAAQKAVELNAKLARREISISEYNELISDIARQDKIDSAMFREDLYVAILKAYKIILALKTFVPMM